jgi:hypothetical protein
MAIKIRSHVERRSGKDRQSGLDTRTDGEKKAVGDRRSGRCSQIGFGSTVPSYLGNRPSQELLVFTA